MPKSFYVCGDSAPARKLGRKYVKEVLREGSYQHPLRPWPTPLSATREYLESVAARTNAGLEADVGVPIPDGHDDTAKDTAGWATNFFVADNEDGTASLMAEMDITDSEYDRKISEGSITKVSVWLADHGDGQFDPGGDRVVHVALTPYPVASKQTGFVALSTGASIPILEPFTEAPMKFSIIASKAKGLGLTVADDVALDAQVEVEADTLVARIEALQTEAAEAATALAARDAQPVDVKKALSVDPKTERFFTRSRDALLAAVGAEVDALLKSGRITLGMKDDVTALLTVEASYSLAADGAASECDVVGLARKILSSLPEQASVPVGERQTPASGTVEAPADDKAAQAAVGDRLAALANK